MGCALPAGIKVIGGIKELTGEEYGVYVKRILPGGVAYADGEWNTGQSAMRCENSPDSGHLFHRFVSSLVRYFGCLFGDFPVVGGIFLAWQLF